ncbi:sugar phosphate isomerase/epimerase [Microbacterium protaetiae]|uniref:Sugar phosphate isomerase/epimerase n=1 Tax=Microbacterium protaetiae TaxID=2509458 RepID=A0A4P6EE69_9MICO|nr:sugar phosphate isomerase/epimerase [Microbacterium protaetiae]QAY59653.1 sugar phosphate isomerase/epimerase [Microbacterium protaetiae]
MSLAAQGVVATCWTSAGAAMPAAPSEASPLSILERVDAVAAAGYIGMGIVYDDLVAIRDNGGFAALREYAHARGVSHLEVELATDWWRDPDEVRWRPRWELLLDAAQEFGSPFIKIGTSFGEKARSITPFVAPLRRLAEEAAAAGTRVGIEPLPFALIASMPQGAQLVRAVDHEAAGLVVDYWHVHRAGTTLDELADALDPSMVFGVELSDATAEPAPGRTLFEDTRDNRRYPGRGDHDVVGFIRTMSSALGWRGPWGVEMLSEEHRALPLDDALRIAFNTTVECLEAASRTH